MMSSNFLFILFVLCFLSFFLPVQSNQVTVIEADFAQVVLSARFNSSSFVKGDSLVIEGSSSKPVQVSAFNEGMKIFAETVDVKDGNFYFSYKIGLADPSGKWSIVVSDGGSSVNRIITVKQSRESSSLRLSFLSPTPTAFRRADKVDIVLRVMAGTALINDAYVYFWNMDGEKVSLVSAGDGTYSYSYNIPKNANLGQWVIRAVALSRGLNESLGGEAEIKLAIEQAAIQFRTMEPVSGEFNFGGPLRIKLELAYSDGSSMLDGNVAAVLSQGSFSSLIQFEPTGDGFFTATFETKDLENSLLNLRVVAVDNFGNKADQLIQLKPKGRFSYFVQENLVVFSAVLLALFFLVAVFYFSVKSGVGKRRSFGEKKKLLLLKKKNQKEYFVDRTITRKIFDQRDAELEMKIREIDAKIIKQALGEKKGQ